MHFKAQHQKARKALKEAEDDEEKKAINEADFMTCPVT